MIKFVGDIMIDTLETNRSKAETLDISNVLKNNLIDKTHAIPVTIPDYGIMTLHRPSNVDDKKSLGSIVDFVINQVLNELTLVWTIHPRTKKQLILYNLWEKLQRIDNLILLNPIGYLELLKLNMEARLVFTDSGGLQEECTLLGTPCITMRFNTERPITLKEFGGVSVLVGNDIGKLTKEFRKTLKSKKIPVNPEFWDGKTAFRCLKAILEN
ncbi:UDP-2,3-diacetamido-2,3-dideoxy-D-glucuronate 2-epimerase [subsurface metagenome]